MSESSLKSASTTNAQVLRLLQWLEEPTVEISSPQTGEATTLEGEQTPFMAALDVSTVPAAEPELDASLLDELLAVELTICTALEPADATHASLEARLIGIAGEGDSVALPSSSPTSRAPARMPVQSAVTSRQTDARLAESRTAQVSSAAAMDSRRSAAKLSRWHWGLACSVAVLLLLGTVYHWRGNGFPGIFHRLPFAAQSDGDGPESVAVVLSPPVHRGSDDRGAPEPGPDPGLDSGPEPALEPAGPRPHWQLWRWSRADAAPERVSLTAISEGIWSASVSYSVGDGAPILQLWWVQTPDSTTDSSFEPRSSAGAVQPIPVRTTFWRVPGGETLRSDAVADSAAPVEPASRAFVEQAQRLELEPQRAFAGELEAEVPTTQPFKLSSLFARGLLPTDRLLLRVQAGADAAAIVIEFKEIAP